MDDVPKRPVKRELLEQGLTFVLGGFGLVAALAWNEAIRSLFDTLFPSKGSSLIPKFGYAVIITIIVVMITIRLRRLIKEDRAE